MEIAGDKRGSSRDLIKSKKRVADHGEVFTPSWLVEAMLDLTDEPERIESRFLEPACGDGNFLVRVLQRKLTVVELKSRQAKQDKQYLALIAMMSIYGIELLEDNIVECRKRLLGTFAKFLKIESSDEVYLAASRVLSFNLVHGDALKMRTNNDRPIIFAEWQYLGRGKFQRRDFRFDLLAQATGSDNLIAPVKVYAPMTIGEIRHSVSSVFHEANL